MPRTATAVRLEDQPVQFGDADTARAALYGGLVAEMLVEIEGRLVSAPPIPEPVDAAHRLSVAAGYLGLAAASAATVAGVLALF